jgi:FkbM family methyltransferase
MDLEAQRLDYPLSSSSLVFDVGAYQGKFSREIQEKHGCRVCAFEPVKAFFQQTKTSVAANPNIAVFNFGLGPVTSQREIAVRADSSGFWLDSAEKETATVWAPEEVMKYLGITAIDLLKINIEGEEYNLLDHILAVGIIEKVKYLQVQFHSYGAAEHNEATRRDAIREGLKRTHDEMWCYPFIWESWARR